MYKIFNVVLPIKTVSEANKSGEHWGAKSKRHRMQRTFVLLSLETRIDVKTLSFPLEIVLTRIAPRTLDIGDNLPMSLKTIRDQIGEYLTQTKRAGRGDGDDRLQFIYQQRKGAPKEYAVQIEINQQL